jgi:hypothetical protein
MTKSLLLNELIHDFSGNFCRRLGAAFDNLLQYKCIKTKTHQKPAWFDTNQTFN